jgi:hypothetical protein
MMAELIMKDGEADVRWRISRFSKRQKKSKA